MPCSAVISSSGSCNPHHGRKATETPCQRRTLRKATGREKLVATFSFSFGLLRKAWSSSEDHPYRSTGGRYWTQVGIDPAGGADPENGETIWSEPQEDLDTWAEHRITAKSESGLVTVYLRGWAEWGMSHNDTYWDDASLVVVALPPGPTATQPWNIPFCEASLWDRDGWTWSLN